MTGLYKLEPRVKQTIMIRIMAALTQPSHDFLKKRYDRVIIRNTQLLGASHFSLVYKDDFYCADIPQARPFPANRLVKELKGEMDSIISDEKLLLNRDTPYLAAAVTTLLNVTNNPMDYFLLFPESLKPALVSVLNTADESTFLGLPRMSSDSIFKFKEDNAIPLLALKTRMAANLLLT